MKYVFSNGSQVEGTLEQIMKVAEVFGEKVDKAKILERPKGYYFSESKGVVKISDMNEVHIRNAITKSTIKYFSELPKAVPISDWMASYFNFQEDILLQELFEELETRKI